MDYEELAERIEDLIVDGDIVVMLRKELMKYKHKASKKKEPLALSTLEAYLSALQERAPERGDRRVHQVPE